jgi:hemolysin activation/secretion protein
MQARIGGILAVLAVVFLPAAALAQVIPPSEQPGRERERFLEPRPPLAQPGAPAVILPSTEAPAGAAQIRVTIRDICIHGATIYTKEQLAPLWADMIGQDVPLQAVYDLAKKVTAKYGNDGYSLSRAIVPPQQFSPGGAVPCLQIIEGYIERVEWPESLKRYRDFFTHYAAMITAERPVNVHTIERYMLLAGDLPGLKFSASLKPSPSKPGASILVVELKEKHFDFLGRIDNRGTQARGPVQFLLSGTANNLIGAHESFNLTWASATQFKELQYYAAGYRQVVTNEGLSVFANASHGPSRPGTAQLEILDYKSLSDIFEVGVASPIIRTREKNLTVTGLFFSSDNTSDSNSEFVRTTDRLRGVRAKVDGDWADAWLGINQFNVAVSQGIDGLGAGAPFPSRAGGKVDFSKVEASVSRTQPLPARFSLFGSLYGQYAMTRLLAPEQCGYGGRFYGRAFDPSQILGDQCIEALGEVRYDLPTFWDQISQVQFYGFSDYGKLWRGLGTTDSLGTTIPSVQAASAGGGVRVGWLNYINADLQVAKALDGPRDDTRFFFSVTGKY